MIPMHVFIICMELWAELMALIGFLLAMEKDEKGSFALGVYAAQCRLQTALK